MKSLFGILIVVWVTQVSGVAQFFFLTHYDRAGNLQWTNLLCTTRPVYEVLRSQSVTGPWTHVAYLTNKTSYTLSNAIPTGSTAFYQLAWTSDTPVTLDYNFDEGFGLPSVIGQITLNFSSLTASWNFQEGPLYDDSSPHPIGTGSGLIAYSSDLRTWFVALRTAMDDAVYLGGFLQSSGTPSGCQYTTYAGGVFYATLSGTDQIGDFVATLP
jgi:hypothetical protein